MDLVERDMNIIYIYILIHIYSHIFIYIHIYRISYIYSIYTSRGRCIYLEPVEDAILKGK